MGRDGRSTDWALPPVATCIISLDGAPYVRPACRLSVNPHDRSAMVKRLEQVAALVVAAGLAIVSYWLFFSWMGQDRRPNRRAALPCLEAAPGLQQPLLGVGVFDAGQVGLHLVSADGQAPAVAQLADAAEGA